MTTQRFTDRAIARIKTVGDLILDTEPYGRVPDQAVDALYSEWQNSVSEPLADGLPQGGQVALAAPVEVVVLTASNPAEMLEQIAEGESADGVVVKPAGVPVGEVKRPGVPKVVAS